MFFFPFFPSVSFPFSPPPVQPQAIAPGQAAPVPPRIKVCDGIRACVRWESNSVETVNTRAPWSTTEPTCPSSPRPQLMSGGPKQRPRSSKCRSASPVRGRHRLCGLPAQPHTHTHTHVPPPMWHRTKECRHVESFARGFHVWPLPPLRFLSKCCPKVEEGPSREPAAPALAAKEQPVVP